VQRERELADQVFAAWETWNKAELDFNALNADTVNRVSGLQWPDRLEAIRNAAQAQHKALAEYAHSLKEYANYLTHLEMERKRWRDRFAKSFLEKPPGQRGLRSRRMPEVVCTGPAHLATSCRRSILSSAISRFFATPPGCYRDGGAGRISGREPERAASGIVRLLWMPEQGHAADRHAIPFCPSCCLFWDPNAS
jgi:hypothetical protein